MEQVERIELFPESGVILFEIYRRVVLHRFPYMAVYLVGDDRLDLLAVVNVGESRPGSKRRSLVGRKALSRAHPRRTAWGSLPFQATRP